MYYVLRAAAKCDAFNDGHVSTISHLTGDKLRAQRFPFPPFDEQQEVVGVLDSQSAPLAHAPDVAQRQIDLLREFGSRLIADVVTGKLDVRKAAARLPDEVEEPELLDEAPSEADGDEASGDDTDEVPEETEA